jgi:hypothetical protein
VGDFDGRFEFPTEFPSAMWNASTGNYKWTPSVQRPRLQRSRGKLLIF